MPPRPEQGFREIDFKAGVNVGITALIYMLLYHLIPGVDHYLNICVMSIAAAFITEADWKKVWAAGLSRCIVIGIGTLFGLVLVFLDGLFHSDVVICVLFGAATVLMLVVEKLTGKMYIQCKLGIVSMALTVFTFREAFYAQVGKTCYGYGVMFFLSTAAVVPICVVTMFFWDAVRGIVQKSSEQS